MGFTMPIACPACQERMAVTELTCAECGTRVQGQFEAPGLARLSPEQMQFVEVFVRNRGNIREVERDLKVSYPTVRSRLDQVILAMGYAVGEKATDEPETDLSATLDALANGELTFDEALQIVKERNA